MVGVAMIDQSAEFDCVDHEIQKEKLKLYGFDEDALAWMTNYLSSRKESCHVESFTSPSLAVSVGVPQGSILGPLITVLSQMIFRDCPWCNLPFRTN
jgi:hypothetical protein